MTKYSTLFSACLRAGFCLVLLLSAHASHGQTVKTVSLKFDKNDYVFEKDSGGNLIIVSNKRHSNYLSKDNALALPFVHFYYLLQRGQSFQNISSTNKRPILLFDNASVGLAPQNIISGKREKAIEGTFNNVMDTYPCKDVVFTGVHDMGEYSVLSFCVCPFVYDVKKSQLFFSSSVDIELSLTDGKSDNNGKTNGSNNPRKRVNLNEQDFIKNLVVNPEDMQNMELPITSSSRDSSHPESHYLIITSPDLVDTFTPLVEWKRKKGLRSSIVTTSEIYAQYADLQISNQLKIKKYLRKYYEDHENPILYVLLGGNGYHVPIQHCKGEYYKVEVEDHHVPTDLYYSCFSGNFEWNANGNNEYGEIVDGVNLYPNIYLTRLPLYFTSEISNYINRLIAYESAPPVSTWEKRILMSGAKIDTIIVIDGRPTSDAQAKSERLYDLYINGIWNGDKYVFYDTYTDLPDSASYELNKDNLQNQLSAGYSFMDFNGHGNEVSWKLETGTYPLEYPPYLQNSQPTLISTTACMTNAFDNWSTLCSSFLGAGNSNVIGYYGSSREGISSFYFSSLGPAEHFVGEYYNSLFRDYSFLSHYSEIVNYSKASFISECMTDSAKRWSMFAFNAMGDPEMPAYTNTPQYFRNIMINYTSSGLYIEQSERNVEMCAMSYNDNGESYYDRCMVNGWSYTFTNLANKDVYISLQKHNYIPFIFRLKNGVIYIDDGTMLGNCTIKGAKVVIGSDIIPENPESNLRIEGKAIIRNHNGVEIKKNFEVPLGSELEINAGN